jgi:Na+/H+ antiporter NhaD/arsenite permease-like protein
MNIAEQAPVWQVIATVVIFLVIYGLVITEKLNRAVLAMLGAVLMVVLGVVDLHKAYQHHIEWQTIFLLLGMMIIVGITNRTGLFQYLSVKAAQSVKGDPVKVLILLAVITAVGSALLDNVTTVLLMVPITLTITRVLHVSPIPYLITEIIASNIGGTATLIGNPPNIMIGTATGLAFNDFIINLAPPAIVIMAATLFLLRKWYAKDLIVQPDRRDELMAIVPEQYIKDRKLLLKSGVILGLTLLGFILHSVIHLEAAVVAMAGATLLMLTGIKERDMEEMFHSIEWVTIFFFAGLFVLVGGLVDVGVISFLATKVLEMTAGSPLFMSILILWISGIASATIDNIPFVATMIPLVQDIGVQLKLSDPSQLNPVWWSLALGACLGGNGTLIGASANLIAAGMADKEGHRISYMEFLKVGIPVTLISLAISTLYVMFVYY